MTPSALLAPTPPPAPPELPATDKRARASSSSARVTAACCVALLLVYVVLSFVIDVRGTLLADSGGKLATLEAMAEGNTLQPDVGYWAAQFDPDGDLHPLVYTQRIDGLWVQATTLPMLYAALPLYDAGGIRLALLVPMLGAVLTALGARALAHRLGGTARDGWLAFWAIGLVTPVLLYALSFWEHTLGLAAMTWGAVLTLDAIARGPSLLRAIAIGVLFGVAATMRTEAVVYFVTTGLIAVAMLARRAPWRRLAGAGAAAVVSFASVTLANDLVERLAVGSIRAGKASGALDRAGDALTTRIEGAATSLVGTNAFGSADLVVGAALVLSIWLAVVLLRSGEQIRRAFGAGVVVIVAMVYVVRFDADVYLPGLLVACPLVACGAFVTWRTAPLRAVGAMAVLPLPLIWATQYVDSQRFQWGNRFALTSAVLLAVAAVVALRERHAALVAVVAISAVVAVFSLAFLRTQTHSIAAGVPRIAAASDALVVSTERHLWREGGAFYDPARRWLAVGDRAELRRAATVAENAGLDRFLVVAASPTDLPATLGGYRRASVVDRLELLPHGPLRVVEYHAT